MSRFLALPLLGALIFSGCRSTSAPSPLLRDLPSESPAAEYAIEVPDGYEVRSMGFGAAYATRVTGGILGQPVTGTSDQQPYVYVHAVESQTGQSVLLIYGDVRRRSEPVAIVRVERGDRLRVTR